MKIKQEERDLTYEVSSGWNEHKWGLNAILTDTWGSGYATDRRGRKKPAANGKVAAMILAIGPESTRITLRGEIRLADSLKDQFSEDVMSAGADRIICKFVECLSLKLGGRLDAPALRTGEVGAPSSPEFPAAPTASEATETSSIETMETPSPIDAFAEGAASVDSDTVSEAPSESANASTGPLVFLCHSSGDKERVRELYRRLSDDNIRCWFDEEDLLPGQNWEYEIARAIRRSRFVLACVSRSSVTKTGYVQKELKKAIDLADEQPEGVAYLIPVRLEECEIPDRLSQWQWVDLFKDNGYERLIRGLKAGLAQ